MDAPWTDARRIDVVLIVDDPLSNRHACCRVRSTALSVAGSVAGVLGLTNWLGFGFYIISVLLTNSLVLTINANGSPSKYFISPSPPAKPLVSSPNSSTSSKKGSTETASSAGPTIDPRSGSFSTQDVAGFLINGLTENAFSFILWWTFWFGIVHGESALETARTIRHRQRADAKTDAHMLGLCFPSLTVYD